GPEGHRCVRRRPHRTGRPDRRRSGGGRPRRGDQHAAVSSSTMPADTVAPGPELRRLAAAHGIATEFTDYTGEARQVSAATVRAVLAALGVPADTDEE